jgi:hypothetical protein
MGGSLELPGLGILYIAPRTKGGPKEKSGRGRLEDVALHDARVIVDGGRRILGRAGPKQEDAWLPRQRSLVLFREKARARLENDWMVVAAILREDTCKEEPYK